MELKLNGTYQLPVYSYADDVNLLGDNIDTIKKNRENLIDASKKVGLEVKAQKIKYLLPSCYQNAGQNHDIKIGNRSFENSAQFKYLGTTVTNQNLIQEEIKRRLNSGTACYHSVQNLLSSHLLSKDIIIRNYNTIILPVVLYGCESWFPILKEEHRLRVFEKTVLRRIFRPKRNEMVEGWRKLHNEDLHSLYTSANIIGMIKSGRVRWAGCVERMDEKKNKYSIFLGKPK
jgi:hypothetical protein